MLARSLALGALFSLVLAGSALAQPVIVEVGANPTQSPEPDYEFFGIHNTGATALDTTGWKFSTPGSGATTVSLPTAKIAPGTTLLVLSNLPALQLAYGCAPHAVDTATWVPLANTGGGITLTDGLGSTLDAVTWSSTVNDTSRVLNTGFYTTVGNDGDTNWVNETFTPCDPPATIAQPGAFSFASTSISGSEGQQVVVNIQRTGGTDQPVSVEVAAAGGTAAVDADFTGTPVRVEFADGQTLGTATLTLVDDAFEEGAETSPLSLRDPLGGASTTSPSQALLTIAASDAPVAATPTPTPTATPAITPTPPVPATVKITSAKPTRTGGATVKVSTTGAGAITATAKLGSKVIATAKKTATAAGSYTLTLKPTKLGAARLKKRKPVKTKLTVTLKRANGTTSTATRTLVLRRR